MNYIIDDVDKKILMYLIDNTRMPFTEIAKKMNVSAGTIHVRVKKLEEAGIIKGTTLITDYDKMGYQFVAYVGLLLTKTNKTQKVIDELYKIPNVTVVHVVSGKYNIFCKSSNTHNHDTRYAATGRFIVGYLRPIPTPFNAQSDNCSMEQVANFFN